jgi:hypothetical protein
MNAYNSRGPQLGCLASLLVLLFGITFLTTSSVNPLDILQSDNLLAKILWVVVAVLLVSGALQYFFMLASLRMIGEDTLCPGCGKPVLQFSGAYGTPVRCPNCHRWWHNGPACYRKGLTGGMLSAEGRKCPICKEEERERSSLPFDLGDLLR